jgi:hypothetical protein
MLPRPCKGVLYPLPPFTSKFQKLVFHGIKIHVDRWHNHLDHPSRYIVRCVIRKNNLSCATFDNYSHSVCDACACAKAHQLPYQLSSSTSSVPLALIFSNVWAPVIESFGRKKYYTSFIDDYSKFTWIYLIHHKSDVFKYFLEFQSLVERMFNNKIFLSSRIGVGSMSVLIHFFVKLALLIKFLAPTLINKTGLLNSITVILLRLA